MEYYARPDGTKRMLKSRIRRCYTALADLQSAVKYLYTHRDHLNEHYAVEDAEHMYEMSHEAARGLTDWPNLVRSTPRSVSSCTAPVAVTVVHLALPTPFAGGAPTLFRLLAGHGNIGFTRGGPWAPTDEIATFIDFVVGAGTTRLPSWDNQDRVRIVTGVAISCRDAFCPRRFVRAGVRWTGMGREMDYPGLALVAVVECVGQLRVEVGHTRGRLGKAYEATEIRRRRRNSHRARYAVRGHKRSIEQDNLWLGRSGLSAIRLVGELTENKRDRSRVQPPGTAHPRPEELSLCG